MYTVPSPHDCGLPPRFQTWRPQQAEGIRILRTSTKRVRALSAPPGSGKTAIYMADAALSGKPTCIVTESRALQQQNMQNYASMGLVNLMGRSNYSCVMRAHDPSYTCDHGHAARCPYKGTVNCPSSFAEIQCAGSLLVQTNYQKWIHNRMFGVGLGHIRRVVFDEGHEMASALSQAMQIILHHHEVEEVLEIDFPHPSEAIFFARWKQWACEARVRCEELLLRAKQEMVDHTNVPKHAKHYTHLRHLARRLAILSTANPNNWVVEELKDGYQFDPIDPARYAESSLLLGVPDIVVVSATLRPKSLYMVGLRPDVFDFTEFRSDFDAARCPIYYLPVMRVDAKATSLKPLWIKIDQLASRRTDRNGIVQSVSYSRRDDVLASSRFAHRMITNQKGEKVTDAIAALITQYPGAILVSPSVSQGFSFDGRAAEWQALCKVPFPPKSKILDARTERDRESPFYLAWQKLGQAAGRLMRSHTDRGETFIFDMHFGAPWFRRYGHFAPKSFWQSFKEIDTLPAPPPRLGV